jgi:PHD/YefM family antitoxin component YafN of YafNO toxin-antitoxin module
MLPEGAMNMNIKPSAAIRKNYNEIAELCKQSGEPVYLTRNGTGDLVVMDIDAFTKRESMLRLREHLVAAEESRLNGRPGYSIDEVSVLMKNAVREVLDGNRQ